MTTEQKCQAILQKIVDICNTHEPSHMAEGFAVAFEQDWGGNSLTLRIAGNGHTHCGIPDGEFSLLIDNLYNTLHGGPGLSFA